MPIFFFMGARIFLKFLASFEGVFAGGGLELKNGDPAGQPE